MPLTQQGPAIANRQPQGLIPLTFAERQEAAPGNSPGAAYHPTQGTAPGKRRPLQSTGQETVTPKVYVPGSVRSSLPGNHAGFHRPPKPASTAGPRGKLLPAFTEPIMPAPTFPEPGTHARKSRKSLLRERYAPRNSATITAETRRCIRRMIRFQTPSKSRRRP